MENVQIISVPIIATIVYWVINLIKYTIKGNEKFKRYIPLVSAGFGAVLGIIGFYLAPQLFGTENIFVAIVIGGASGLSATGTNQIFKQLSYANIEQSKENKNIKSK
ncbi:MAG: phage holin family protein [Clostridia bacterium]